MAEISFAGETFTVADSIGLMPMMRLAKVAQSGADADDMAALAALYDVLQQCITDADWHRFEAAADRTRADGEALQVVVADAMRVISGRPTSRPSDSSDGPASMALSSADTSSSEVVSRLEAQGRPDLALLVTQTQEQLSA